jgi:hypothetical protein
MPCQKHQHVKLFRGELYFLAANRDLMGSKVDVKVAVFDDVTLRILPNFRHPLQQVPQP